MDDEHVEFYFWSLIITFMMLHSCTAIINGMGLVCYRCWSWGSIWPCVKLTVKERVNVLDVHLNNKMPSRGRNVLEGCPTSYAALRTVQSKLDKADHSSTAQWHPVQSFLLLDASPVLSPDFSPGDLVRYQHDGKISEAEVKQKRTIPLENGQLFTTYDILLYPVFEFRAEYTEDVKSFKLRDRRPLAKNVLPHQLRRMSGQTSNSFSFSKRDWVEKKSFSDTQFTLSKRAHLAFLESKQSKEEQSELEMGEKGGGNKEEDALGHPVWLRAEVKEVAEEYAFGSNASVFALTLTQSDAEKVQHISGVVIRDAPELHKMSWTATERVIIWNKWLESEKKRPKRCPKETIRFVTLASRTPDLLEHVLPYYPQGAPVAIAVPPYTLFGDVCKEHTQKIRTVRICSSGETGNLVDKDTRTFLTLNASDLEAGKSYDVSLLNPEHGIITIESFKGEELRVHGETQFYDVKLDDSSRQFVETLANDHAESGQLCEIHSSMLSPVSWHQQQGWKYEEPGKQSPLTDKLKQMFSTKAPEKTFGEKQHFLDIGDAVLVMDQNTFMQRRGVVCGLSQHQNKVPKIKVKSQQHWYLNRSDAYDIQWGDGPANVTKEVDWKYIRPLRSSYQDERKVKYAVGEIVLCSLNGTNDHFEAVITGVNSKDRARLPNEEECKIFTYSVRYEYAREKGIETAQENNVSVWRLSPTRVLESGVFCPSIHHVELHALPEHSALTHTSLLKFFRCVL
jgi:hypothetical protein